MIATLSLYALPGQLGNIFYFIVLPMLLIAGVGFVLQRRLHLNMQTLTWLNFYFVIPAMIYYAVVTSPVSAGEAIWAVVLALGLIVVMAIVTMIVAVVRGVPKDQRSALMMTTIFFNAGNYGLPLQDLAFRSAGNSALGMSFQSFVMITQNVVTFTLGILLVASGRKDRHWKDNLKHIVKFPPIYALAAGLLTVQIRNWIGPENSDAAAYWCSPAWVALLYIKDAFVAIAILTLGAQLATVKPVPHSYPVKLSVFLRLLVGPAIGLGLIYALGINGLLAQVLIISTSTPTAVNTMLLCLEFNNHPEFAARAVFYSTLLSPITITLVVFLAQCGVLSVFD
ncbi:MAG: AEC family transporter [Planctomycetaceae bacterium]|nr:MAG: AEC family transporter [Planctomycetaceae bacterium]